MNKSYLSVSRTGKDLELHPVTTYFERWLNEQWIDPDSIRVNGRNGILWHFRLYPGIYTRLCIFEENQKLYYSISSKLTPIKLTLREKILVWMHEKNRELEHPISISLTPAKSMVVGACGPAAGIQEQALRYQIGKTRTLAREYILELYDKFGLMPIQTGRMSPTWKR